MKKCFAHVASAQMCVYSNKQKSKLAVLIHFSFLRLVVTNQCDDIFGLCTFSPRQCAVAVFCGS